MIVRCATGDRHPARGASELVPDEEGERSDRRVTSLCDVGEARRRLRPRLAAEEAPKEPVALHRATVHGAQKFARLSIRSRSIWCWW